QFALRGNVKQLIVGNAAPEEKREPRRQFQIAHSVRTAWRYLSWVALHAEKKLRTREHLAQGRCDSRIEIAFRAPFAEKRHRLVNFRLRDGAAVSAPHYCGQNLCGTLFFLRFTWSRWPANKQTAAAGCVSGAFWRIRPGNGNLVDGGRGARIPP